MKLMDKAKQAALAAAVKTGLGYLEKDPEVNIPKLMELVDKFVPDGWYESQRNAIRNAIQDKDSNWYKLILRIYELDPGVREAFFTNFIINASLKGSALQEETAEENNCNVPWAILLDPTSACNLHCTGCWAAEYGHKLNLDFDTICSIVEQGRKMGTYMYIYTGGEPLVRKKDLMRICEKYPDCEFLSFTNGTLIDEEFCQEMLRVKNFVPAISLEGSEEANDGRRGEGVYQKVMHAMELLKAHKLPFGVSTCYTSANVDSVSSEEFFDHIIDCGALFVWFFHYMPVGSDADQNLLLSPEQREHVYRTIREKRDGKNGKPIFTVDFQNDAEFVGGCIAGGRNYFHINSEGDAEPCVFIHYSDSNIRQKSIKECLQSPLFYEYYKGQPFNNNMLRPCPMLENPAALRRIVSQTGAKSTNFLAPESAEALCAKCDAYAAAWAPTAKRIWEEKSRFRPFTQYYRDTPEGKTDGEVQKLQNLPLPTEK